MSKNDDIISADSRFKVEFIKRDDATHGYVEFKNAGDAASPVWQRHSTAGSRFASAEIALEDARGRLAWLRQEMAWPARDLEPIAQIEYTPGWIRCPFCDIRFSLLDANRWGGGRHLSCGQKIIPTPQN